MSEDQGLSTAEAAARLARDGPNELTSVKRLSVLLQLLSFFTNPLVLILILACIVAAFVGDTTNSLIIAMVVVFSVLLNFVQSYRANKAAELLRTQVAPTAAVLRDQKWTEIPLREVVVGDAIQLAAGDLVPADAQLVEARDLHVNEAALTGESLPVEKAVYKRNDKDGDQRSSQVFLGTSVVSGMATAVVTVTGPRTSFGEISTQLAARPPETEFERGTRNFGMFITKTVLFLVLLVLMINLLERRDPIQSLLFALALAVGLTPEFLPMIMTVTLGQAALKMAKKKVIVKHLAAIQNFGSIDVLCSDKTGTLTEGNMVLHVCCDALGQDSEQPWRFAYLNSFFENGIKNPLDSAILKYKAHDEVTARKLDEIPFDFERRRLTVVIEQDGERLLITKGAPESVLSCCDSYVLSGASKPLTEDVRATADSVWRALSQQGHRVIGVASMVPSEQQESWSAKDEKHLILTGFLAFADPPAADAAKTISALRHDGVQVKILTGDNEIVSRQICSQVGLNVENVITGSELERLTPQALAHVVENHQVFARVTPAQKLRIILTLKSQGHIVGFLGDGINDAPSLHAADVGISVANAVEVAKDSAEIILLERKLKVLHEGIIQGRKAFGNVIKYLLMGTSSNFGNMFSMAAAAAFLPFLPMLPTQILLNNFLYDLAQLTIPTDNVDKSYVKKPHRWDIALIRNFMICIGPISSVYDFLTFFVLINVFHASERLFHTGWFIESLATQTLVLFIIRTSGNPLRSRPSKPLIVTTTLTLLIGVLLPFTPAAPMLGFVSLPASYFLFLALAISTYLCLVQLVKRQLMR